MYPSSNVKIVIHVCCTFVMPLMPQSNLENFCRIKNTKVKEYRLFKKTPRDISQN